ncbi:malate synthase G [Bremerella sp. T1]|uniref:malate synthase G n=1 Tax=Bremerella sp. TYQ1 TaxID=3119568 RepID=UPI001CCA77CF|nr:malate synthase G [Bremerella volcania]UBM36723.1 malate synthase G [Bremerella volcania]
MIETSYRSIAGLQIANELADFVAQEVVPGTGTTSDEVWRLLASLVEQLGERNRELLKTRDELQAKLDQWYKDHRGISFSAAEHQAFLKEIGYLVDPPSESKVTTQGVDPEIATIAAPQLVVPLDNARYAINAANARWGSLFDALYGTNAIPFEDTREAVHGYDQARGMLVIQQANRYLDEFLPFQEFSWNQLNRIVLNENNGSVAVSFLTVQGNEAKLADPNCLVGYNASSASVFSLLFAHHGLHIEIQVDPNHPVGQQHAAGIKDVILEAAVTTIQDCEDSVAAVDAVDKVQVYRNWLSLMKGDLTATFSKGGNQINRVLSEDREFQTFGQETIHLPGRSLLLVRIVGMHMHTDAVLTKDGIPIPEAFLDAVLVTLAALHDLKGQGRFQNSKTGSVYIVKPKQHGPEEVTLTVDLFAKVESAFGLPEGTLKLGIMDEERRTSANLLACLERAASRVVFINTGFLDRTGDEIHSRMQLGPFVRKDAIKESVWLNAYERNNVAAGHASKLDQVGQIGKGMWAMPDQMAEMLGSKHKQLEAGATTAWVPSPTAAVLHAIHYHQFEAASQRTGDHCESLLAGLLTVEPFDAQDLSPDQIQHELNNNCQSILGYVSRWINLGVGCSKVPDLNGTGLMEDRATLRISSQLLANWLLHKVISHEELEASFNAMAAVVDQQQGASSEYCPFGESPEDSLAFQAAQTLVLEGVDEPNGYTEPTLFRYRKLAKQQVVANSSPA